MKTWLMTFVMGLLMCCGPVLSLALTPEQVLQLKKAGVEEKTIQLMIEQEIAAQQTDPYEKMGTREIKDQNGDTVVIYSTGKPGCGSLDREEQEKVDRAWEMLRNMSIEVK